MIMIWRILILCCTASAAASSIAGSALRANRQAKRQFYCPCQCMYASPAATSYPVTPALMGSFSLLAGDADPTRLVPAFCRLA
jgi:hypothetical protein